MGLEQNSVDGSGAMDEEERRRIEADLIEAVPSLRYSRANLKQLVDSIVAVRGAALRPSEAIDSQGRVNGSDLGQDKDFFENMESYRKSNMGNGFELPEGGFHTQQDIRNMDPSRMNPSDQRHGTMSPGQSWVRNALAGTGRTPPADNTFEGNQDPNENSFGAGGKTVADDEITPGGGPLGHDPGVIRRLAAAGRFGLRRTR